MEKIRILWEKNHTYVYENQLVIFLIQCKFELKLNVYIDEGKIGHEMITIQAG